MFRILLPAIVTLVFLPVIIEAQEKIPTLKGKMVLSIKDGTMDCDFTLSDMPRTADYLLLVNAGMNMRSIKKTDGSYSFYYERVYNDTNAYESFGYYIPDNTGKAKFQPDALSFNYTGKFPVVVDTLDAPRQDWKGNIAFNGYSVRADGVQSTWYPVLFDLKKDKKYDEVKYDIEIECKDCSVIYINGNDPVNGTKAAFKSNDPTELMLYAGNFRLNNVGGTFFLNPDITEPQMKEFGEMTNSFKKFYERKLGIPYKRNIIYIQTTPVSKQNAWLFVAYPTIVNIGHADYGMNKFFTEKRRDWARTFMAHELAHYYFGTYKRFNSGMGDMCSEGFAEYLALQVAREFFPDSIYKSKIREMKKNLEKFTPTPFYSIKNESDYKNRQLYVYSYTPLVLTAIEKEIGRDKMWQWMKLILETEAEFTDYSFLTQALKQVIKDDKKLSLVEAKYFKDEHSLENTIAAIDKN